MINWRFKNRILRPIGLDIGHSFIKMIQLSIHEGHISILAAEKARIETVSDTDPDERRKVIVSTINRMLSEGNFRGRDVVSCLPNEQLKITSLRLGEEETQDIERALRKEVAHRFGLDPDKDSVNYMVAGNVWQGDETKNELILFGAEDETIRSHIKMLEQVGLRPVSIDTVPCALFRSFERSLRRQEDRERTVVFVDVGSHFTTVVFGCGEEISFVKQIPIGGAKFNQAIASKLGIDVQKAGVLRNKLRMAKQSLGAGLPNQKTMTAGASDEKGDVAPGQLNSLDASTRQVMVDAIGTVAEELANEISLCFRYYTVTFRGKRVEQAVFAGGEAYEGILLNVLRRQLAVEVGVAEPLRGFDMMNVDFGSDRRSLHCEWAVAVGLGLKGWRSKPEREKAQAAAV
jgi:type IV pilus assembly protein PilM